MADAETQPQTTMVATDKQLAQKARIEEQRKAVAQVVDARQQAYREGRAASLLGGKLKANPHEAGSDLWWSWHNGYREHRATLEAQKRRDLRLPSGKAKVGTKTKAKAKK